MRHFSFRPTLTIKGRKFKGLRGFSGNPPIRLTVDLGLCWSSITPRLIHRLPSWSSAWSPPCSSPSDPPTAARSCSTTASTSRPPATTPPGIARRTMYSPASTPSMSLATVRVAPQPRRTTDAPARRPHPLLVPSNDHSILLRAQGHEAGSPDDHVGRVPKLILLDRDAGECLTNGVTDPHHW
jgi:hypothetical protein